MRGPDADKSLHLKAVPPLVSELDPVFAPGYVEGLLQSQRLRQAPEHLPVLSMTRR